jgi:lysozyme family protein
MTRDTSPEALQPHYKEKLSTLKINDSPVSQSAKKIAKEICVNQQKYYAVMMATGAPWQFVGVLHHMECGGDFTQHLANGDPINAPTINEPVGIPAGTWEECAIFVLKNKGYRLDDEKDWQSIWRWLWRAEAYNGFGYLKKHPETLSPYLWSGTNHYSKGKYVADGKWDSEAVSQQLGVVAIWVELGVIDGASKALPGSPIGTSWLTPDGIVVGVVGQLNQPQQSNAEDYTQYKPGFRTTPPPKIEFVISNNLKIINTRGANITVKNAMATPTPIARLTVTNSNGTPLKIGAKLKAKKDLQDHEYIDLPCGKTVELSKVVSLNDRSHYRVEAIGNSGESRLAWVYMNDAGIEYLNSTSGEGHPDIYAAPKKDVKPIDPSDKKAIQRELSRVGLLDGRKGFDDGKWGGLSESAMRAWKRHYGSDDTVKALAGLQQAKGFKELDLRPKDPNKTSHKIATACLKRMLELDMWLAVSFGSESFAWNFFYVNGTNADGSFNKDSIDNMNDLRFLAKINPDGTVEVGYISVATWDAGWKYRKDRMNSNGCFQVDYDKQFWSWRPGTHGTAAPHAALTQQDDGDPLTGTRDNDENGRTSTDKHYDDGGAVNHHGTVGRRPGQPIGPYSAGCGVDDDINAHLNIFMPKIKADRRVKASYGHLINSCFLDRSKVKSLPLS